MDFHDIRQTEDKKHTSSEDCGFSTVRNAERGMNQQDQPDYTPKCCLDIVGNLEHSVVSSHRIRHVEQQLGLSPS